MLLEYIRTFLSACGTPIDVFHTWIEVFGYNHHPQSCILVVMLQLRPLRNCVEARLRNFLLADGSQSKLLLLGHFCDYTSVLALSLCRKRKLNLTLLSKDAGFIELLEH